MVLSVSIVIADIVLTIVFQNSFCRLFVTPLMVLVITEDETKNLSIEDRALMSFAIKSLI